MMASVIAMPIASWVMQFSATVVARLVLSSDAIRSVITTKAISTASCSGNQRRAFGHVVG